MHDELMQIVRRQVSYLNDTGAIFISASEVAEGVYAEIDPERQAPSMVQYTSKNDLRRRAELALRGSHQEEEEIVESGQQDAFRGHLQTRYPCEREGVRGYVLLEEMTFEEIDHNVDRLEKEAIGKQRHADALRAYGANRR